MTRRSVSAMAILSLALCTARAAAVEVFKWVDEDGVVHFTDERPVATTAEITHFVITPSNPLDYDPVEDEYSVKNQAARTNDYFKKIAERREERAKKRAEAAEKAAQNRPRFVRYYDATVRSYYRPYYWPVRPVHPIYPVKPGHYPRPVPFGPMPAHRPSRPAHPAAPARPRPVRPAPRSPAPMSTSGPAVRWAPSQHPH